MPAFDVACALLVLAGALKLRTPAPTIRSLVLAGARVPAIAVRALGVAEVVAGAAAALRPAPVTAGVVALGYAGFCAFLIRLRSVGTEEECGCFGGTDANVSAVHIALNGVACALAIVASLDPPPGLGWIATRAPVVAVPTALGTAAAVFAAYLAVTVLPAAWRTYGGGAP